MKKLKHLILGTVLGVLLTIPVTGFADSVVERISSHIRPDISVELNEEEVQLDSNVITTQEGRSYLPLRELGELLEFSVSWDGENKKIVLETVQEEPVDDATPEIEDSPEQDIKILDEVQLSTKGLLYPVGDNPILNYDNMTYVPLNALENTLGHTTEWSHNQQVLRIEPQTDVLDTKAYVSYPAFVSAYVEETGILPFLEYPQDHNRGYYVLYPEGRQNSTGIELSYANDFVKITSSIEMNPDYISLDTAAKLLDRDPNELVEELKLTKYYY